LNLVGGLGFRLGFRSGFRGAGGGFTAFGSDGVGAGEVVAFFSGDGNNGSNLDGFASITDLNEEKSREVRIRICTTHNDLGHDTVILSFYVHSSLVGFLKEKGLVKVSCTQSSRIRVHPSFHIDD
jgi:hypothetical protein